VRGVLALLLAVLTAVTLAPPAGAQVRLLSQQARWTGLGQPDALGDDREPWFLQAHGPERSPSPRTLMSSNPHVLEP
jgi:hypothetical protein